MPENLIPPRAASRLLGCFCFGNPHLQQILGDLMEELNERAQTDGLAAARRWYWREVLRNAIVLAGRSKMTDKARTKMLFGISGVWVSVAVLCGWFTRGWLVAAEHQEWGTMTGVVFLAYVVLVIGWLVPLSWAFFRLVSPSALQSK